MKERKSSCCLYINTRHGDSILHPRRNQGAKIMSLKPRKTTVCAYVSIIRRQLLNNLLHDTSIFSFVRHATLFIHPRILSVIVVKLFVRDFIASSSDSSRLSFCLGFLACVQLGYIQFSTFIFSLCLHLFFPSNAYAVVYLFIFLFSLSSDFVCAFFCLLKRKCGFSHFPITH